MPTKEGWPTVDEERAMKERAKALRKNPAADFSTDALLMTVSLNLGQWKALLAGDEDALAYMRKLLEAHLDMANQIR